MARRPDPSVNSKATTPMLGTGRSLPLSLLISLRPKQWTKNLFVFAGLIFSEQKKLLDPNAVVRSMAAFAVFCALSGVVYLVNDVRDREADRLHPSKSRRPIASGAISPQFAIAAAAVLGAAALIAAFVLGRSFGIAALTYLSLLILYSTSLKHIVILDALTIAVGFVLRAIA